MERNLIKKCVSCEQVFHAKVAFCPYCGVSQLAKKLPEAQVFLQGQTVSSPPLNGGPGYAEDYVSSEDLDDLNLESEKLLDPMVEETGDEAVSEPPQLEPNIKESASLQHELDDPPDAVLRSEGEKSKILLFGVLLLVVSVLVFGSWQFGTREKTAPDDTASTRRTADVCKEVFSTAKGLIDSGHPSKALQSLELFYKDCENTSQFIDLKSSASLAIKSANEYIQHASESMDTGLLENASENLDEAFKFDKDSPDIKKMIEELRRRFDEVEKFANVNNGSTVDLAPTLGGVDDSIKRKNQQDDKIDQLLKGETKKENNKNENRMEELLNK